MNNQTSDDDFVAVSEADFYRSIGPRNVHPRVVGGWGQYCDGYRSDFVTPDGAVVGRCLDGSPQRHFLARSST